MDTLRICIDSLKYTATWLLFDWFKPCYSCSNQLAISGLLTHPQLSLSDKSTGFPFYLLDSVW